MSDHKRLAFALLRVAIGVNFCGHGFVRIVRGIPAFAHGTQQHLAGGLLPAGFTYAFACAIPVIEAVLGVMLVAGLFTRAACVAGAVFMMSLTVGVASIQDWGTAGTQLLYSLVFFVLLFLAEYDAYGLDGLRRS